MTPLWLIHNHDLFVTYGCRRYDTFVTHPKSRLIRYSFLTHSWLFGAGDMTHSWLIHNHEMTHPWLIRESFVTGSWLKRDSLGSERDSFVTLWGGKPVSFVTWLIRDSFIITKRLIRDSWGEGDMTNLWFDSFVPLGGGGVFWYGEFVLMQSWLLWFCFDWGAHVFFFCVA